MNNIERSFFIHRYICDVFSEMRECVKTGNYSYLPGLIEEAQSMGNRMESALGDSKDIPEMTKQWHKYKKKIKKAKKKLAKLEKKLEDWKEFNYVIY